jgi:uncharacterized membrane protein HdeD (DUF308 family)
VPCSRGIALAPVAGPDNHYKKIKKEKEKMTEAMTFETKQYPWWLLLMGGALNIIVGILLLTSPAKTVTAFVWVLGIYWFVHGIFVLVGMFIDHSAWGWKLFMGLLSMMAGIVVMRQPIVSAVALPMIFVLMLGIQGLIIGTISLVMAFKGGGWGAGILGVISIFFGLILIGNYASLATVVTFIWVVAGFAIVGGIVQIVQAFGQRNP